MDTRFERNIGALSLQEQRRLFDKSVCIIGCGGIGSRLSELLLRAGISKLTLIDPAHFEASDFNRHPFFRPSAYKVTATKAALLRMNSDADISTFKKVCEVPLPSGFNLYVDATDSPATHRLIEESNPSILLHAFTRGYIAKIIVSVPSSTLISDCYTDLRPVRYPSGKLGAMDAFCAAMLCFEAVKILSSEPIKADPSISEFCLL